MKTMLVDVDGVLLGWNIAFVEWMFLNGFEEVPDSEHHYHINERFGISREYAKKLAISFNNGPSIRNLRPIRNAEIYLPKLHDELGYNFHAITSLSSQTHAGKNREYNLNNVFGIDMFEKVICLETGAPKEKILDKYRDSGLYWVEDNVENAVAGYLAGLNTFLMDHPYNQFVPTSGVTRVSDWKDIYERIVNG